MSNIKRKGKPAQLLKKNPVNVASKEQALIPKKQGRIRKFFSSIYVRGLGIATLLLTLFAVKDSIMDFFSSKHEIYERENVTSGNIKSPKLSENNSYKQRFKFYYNPKTYNYPLINGVHIKNLSATDSLNIVYAGVSAISSVKAIYDGTFTIQFGGIGSSCEPITLHFAAKEDRLYVSSKFVDLGEPSKEIGEMEYNHWKIYDGRYTDYRCTDSSFELIDLKGYVVFRMSYSEQKHLVSITGYFNNPDCIYILHDQPTGWFFPKTDANWKRKAEVEINKIERVLKSKCN